MERPLLLFRRGPSTPTPYAFFLPWSIWVDQGSRVSSFTPRKRMVSTHWTGSPKSWSGRGFRMRLSALAKNNAELFETFMAILHSLCHRSRSEMSPGIWQAALADGTWLWRPCHPHRELNRRGGKAKACRWHRLNRTGEFISPWDAPVRMRQVDVAVCNDASNVRQFS
jgi:hypothetical protein